MKDFELAPQHHIHEFGPELQWILRELAVANGEAEEFWIDSLITDESRIGDFITPFSPVAACEKVAAALGVSVTRSMYLWEVAQALRAK